MISIAGIWNEVIEKDHGSREFKARDYIYASELGGSKFDTWMKMKGIPPTTPPNARSFRKFNAGNTWEWIVRTVFIQAGILLEDQRHVVREPSGEMCGIHGRVDFVLDPDAKPFKVDYDLPPFIGEIIKEAEKLMIPERTILELKTVSSMMFPMREEEPAVNHKLQAGFYGIEEKLPSMVMYVNKDTCELAEHLIDLAETKEIMDAWVGELSGYYLSNERPPLEDLIINENGRLYKNWKVEYSSYLNEYGFDSPIHYRDRVDKWVSRWNRVLKRMQEEKKLTADNEKAIDEMRTYFETGKFPT